MGNARQICCGVAALCAAAFGLVLLVSKDAAAQVWPSRPITLVVSQAAGASPDVMARLLADRLSRSLGQGVIIENKPGAANVVGATAIARAAPDGYTFFFATSAALVSNPFLLEKMTYDPVKDFAPISLVARSHQMIVVHPDVPAQNLRELIELDRKQPGALSVAVDSPRNLAGITAQALKKRANMEWVLVPFPNIANAPQDVMAGRLQAGVFSVAVVESLVREGKLRAIAVASEKRSATFPGVATVSETIKDFDFAGWFMLMAPAGTPQPIIARMNAEVAQALRDERIRETAPTLGFEIETTSPEGGSKLLAEQLLLWKNITTELGLKPQ